MPVPSLEETRTHVRNIEDLLSRIDQEPLGATLGEQGNLRYVLDEVRGVICETLVPHLADARLTRFDELAPQCGTKQMTKYTHDLLRHTLLRIIAAERLGIPYDPLAATTEHSSVISGALSALHAFTFREDWPYDGDRTALLELINLFSEIKFPR